MVRTLVFVMIILTGCRMQHVGIRGALGTWEDEENDYKFGWIISYAEDIEEVGWRGIAKQIREVVGDNPVYSE